ncbi:EI24 domain-containing protein tank [Brevipalpus obovatus]|uniref:EI24 domain-containing protein tank n=1 Tax=Brevipalpus obovatus TaxID=246614 RepID=UPI003D9F6F6B
MDLAKSVSIGFFHGFKDSIFGIFAIRYAIFSNDDQNKSQSASSSSTATASSSSSGSSKRTLGSSSRLSKSRKNTMQMIFQCCLLNGCIFWLSLILFDYVMLPLLYSLLRLMFGTQSGLASTVWYWMRPILSHIFDAVWRIPLFLLTRVVNALWFQDIADSTYRGRPSLKSISKLIADTLFSLLIQTLFLIQSLIIAFIPFPLLGRFASLFHLCLLYALYSFEYKWSNMGWELHTRLQVIENNWPYFFGFGAPLAILTSLSDSYFVSGCIFSLLFPLFIISGNEAKPRKVLYDQPLKIFQLVIWLSNKLFQGTIYVTGSSHGRTLINKYKTR